METQKSTNIMKAAVKAAFPHTIPVLTGYVFMGIAFGILLTSKGYSPVWAFFMSIFVYAGSMQFVAVDLLIAGFNPLVAFAMTLMVNARYIFYGISMLEKFKCFGKIKIYMMFALTDETFSLLCAAKPPKEVKPKHFYMAIAMMDHLYWICGCTIGGIVGAALPINTAGIDFVMTALFVVILLEQWQKKTNRPMAIIGLGVSVVCRLIFGADKFIVVAMALLVAVFCAARKPLERSLKSL